MGWAITRGAAWPSGPGGAYPRRCPPGARCRAVKHHPHELLRAVNIAALDTGIDLLPNTQTASRRSTLINARGQASLELPLSLTATEQKSIAERMLKVAWGELHRFEFELPVAWSFLTPTDIITLSEPYKRVSDWIDWSLPEEATIVFLSDAVQFFPLAPEYIGATIHLRAFSHDGDAGTQD